MASKAKPNQTSRQQTASSSGKRIWLIAGIITIAVAVVLVAMLPGILNAEIEAAESENAAGAGAVQQAPQRIDPQTYVAQFEDTPHFLLDVRTPQEFAGGHLEGAANIAVETLQANLDAIPRDQPIVLYCRSGNRSAQAASILDAAGFTNIYDLGGIVAWQQAGLPVVQ
jgi:rhodanese-related sulfurtransferase